MKPIWRRSFSLVTLLALTLGAVVAGHAWADHDHFAARGRAFISKRIDAALDAVKATDSQRTAILAARDHVFATMDQARAHHTAQLDDALNLFAADQIDAAKVAAHRARNEADHQAVGDAMVQAITDAHDALTQEQRQQLVDYLRDQRAKHQGRHQAMREKFMHRMVDARIEAALNEINATPAQRQTVEAAKQNVLAAFTAEESGAQLFAQLIDLFNQPMLDQHQLALLRAEHQARAQKIGDAIVTGLTQIHDVLSHEQRQTVVAFVRAHRHS